MLRQLLLCAGLMTLPLAALGEDTTGKRPSSPTNLAFETMKSLEGTWLAADDDGKPTSQVVSVIKVTAGGSVVHETLFPGQAEEMVSVYTVERSGSHHDALLRAGQPAAAEGRPEIAGQPDPLRVRRRHQPRPGEGQAHAFRDADDRRPRPHRDQGGRLAGRRATKDMCCAKKLVRKK